ncbi:MAG: hypothetical protein J5620_02970 [Alphaproteobacteria bacterium]|nr:hypothetical protein [Alphaproteobacteria bacterium]
MVQKWRFFATFLISTFELFVGIAGDDFAKILFSRQLRSSPVGRPPYFRLAFACGEPPYLGGSNPTQHTLNKNCTVFGAIFI